MPTTKPRRPKPLDPAALRDYLRRCTDEVIDNLLDLMRNSNSERIRFCACHELMLRGWGRPRPADPPPPEPQPYNYKIRELSVVNNEGELTYTPEIVWATMWLGDPNRPPMPPDFLAEFPLSKLCAGRTDTAPAHPAPATAAPATAAPSTSPHPTAPASAPTENRKPRIEDATPPSSSSAFRILASAFIFLLSLFALIASTARASIPAPIDLAPTSVATQPELKPAAIIGQSKHQPPQPTIPKLAQSRQGATILSHHPPRLRVSARDIPRVFFPAPHVPPTLARGAPPAAVGAVC